MVQGFQTIIHLYTADLPVVNIAQNSVYVLLGVVDLLESQVIIGLDQLHHFRQECLVVGTVENRGVAVEPFVRSERHSNIGKLQ